LRELEREYILETLRETGGNKLRAAEMLGVDRKTLYRKLDEYRSEDPTLEV
jgi:DNA-binding NtrC family response regulator